MKKILLFTIIVLAYACGENKTKKEILRSKFEQVSNTEIVKIKGSLFKVFESKNKKAPFGDFMSKIWNNYGENLESIGKPKKQKGDTYVFRHKETGIIFSAYPGGFGPSFGGSKKNKEKLNLIIAEFEELLELSENADCEFVLITDNGRFKIGAKSGQPFDILVPYTEEDY